LGYFIGENYWNKGIMMQVVKEMVAYAFLHFPELRKIYALAFRVAANSFHYLRKQR
jgi:RimJ/RimL family protein N-acetyltransferase